MAGGMRPEGAQGFFPPDDNLGSTNSLALAKMIVGLSDFRKS